MHMHTRRRERREESMARSLLGIVVPRATKVESPALPSALRFLVRQPFDTNSVGIEGRRLQDLSPTPSTLRDPALALLSS